LDEDYLNRVIMIYQKLIFPQLVIYQIQRRMKTIAVERKMLMNYMEYY